MCDGVLTSERPDEQRLEAWLKEMGADISALRVADFSDGVRGLEATRDLAEGEFVLTVVRRGLPILPHHLSS